MALNRLLLLAPVDAVVVAVISVMAREMKLKEKKGRDKDRERGGTTI